MEPSCTPESSGILSCKVGMTICLHLGTVNRTWACVATGLQSLSRPLSRSCQGAAYCWLPPHLAIATTLAALQLHCCIHCWPSCGTATAGGAWRAASLRTLKEQHVLPVSCLGAHTARPFSLALPATALLVSWVRVTATEGAGAPPPAPWPGSLGSRPSLSATGPPNHISLMDNPEGL